MPIFWYSVLKIIITGSHGLVGTTLLSVLKSAGNEVTPLVRTGHDGILWNPPFEGPNPNAMTGCDAVVHLAGENIGVRRWSTAQKKRLYESRVNATRVLCQSLVSMDQVPRVLLSASAIGIYGDQGDELLTEDSPSGDGFLAKMAHDWEATTMVAQDAGIRVVHLRFGIVLSPKGGALAKMLTPFKFCLGGRVGDGCQWWSWVSVSDAVRAILYCLENESLSGPVNVAAGAETNVDFAKTLGMSLRRPACFPLPAFMARLILGEMADALLLASIRVESRKLREQGFEFKQNQLATAFKELLPI